MHALVVDNVVVLTSISSNGSTVEHVVLSSFVHALLVYVGDRCVL
jgi:hypothetical protein